MTLAPWPIRFTLQISHIHDGDTIMGDLAADAGLGVHVTLTDWAVRFYGINAPELATDAGKQSLAYLESLVAGETTLTVDSYSWDKYGRRVDGVPWTSGGVDLCAAMLAAAQAVAYP